MKQPDSRPILMTSLLWHYIPIRTALLELTRPSRVSRPVGFQCRFANHSVVSKAFQVLSDNNMRAAFDSNPTYDPTQRNPGNGGGGMRSQFNRGGGGGGMYADELNPEDLFNMFFGGGGRQFGGGQFGNANGEHFHARLGRPRADWQYSLLVDLEVSGRLTAAVLNVDHVKQKVPMPTHWSPYYPSLSSLLSPSSLSYHPYCRAHWSLIQDTHSSQWVNTRWIEVHGNEALNTMSTSLNGRNRVFGNLYRRRKRARRIWQCLATRLGYSRRASRMITSTGYAKRSVPDQISLKKSVLTV